MLCYTTGKTDRVVLSSVLHLKVPLGRVFLEDLAVYTVHPHS